MNASSITFDALTSEGVRPKMSIKERVRTWATERRLKHRHDGRITAEGVGFGLALSGGVVALGSLLGVLFVPVASFPVVDAEVGALFGGILFVAGLIVHAAD